MQRHRHNVKVLKLLVGLRPYQGYTKRHPCHQHLSGYTEAQINNRIKYLGRLFKEGKHDIL